jgi:hypothetical protein
MRFRTAFGFEGDFLAQMLFDSVASLHCRSFSKRYSVQNALVAQVDLEIAGGGVVSGYLLNDTSTGVLIILGFYQYDDNTKQFN